MEDHRTLYEEVYDRGGQDNKISNVDAIEKARKPASADTTKGLDGFGKAVDAEMKEEDDVMKEPEEGSMCHALLGVFSGRRGSKGSFDGRQGLAFNYTPGSRYFGMFTDEGNEFVANFVNNARQEGWDWPQTLEAIIEISETRKEYGEMCDTMVKELIYDAIGATGKFYIS